MIKALIYIDYLKLFLSQDVGFVDAWRIGNSSETKRYSSCLRRFGFMPLPIGSHFDLKLLRGKEAPPGNLVDLDQWFITSLFSEGVG